MTENRNKHSDKPCMRCGDARHPTKDQCPALRGTCRKCHRVGHYARVCLSKKAAVTAREVLVDSEEDDGAFLGSVTSDKSSAWTVRIRLEEEEFPFKMDTGAEVTVISEDTYDALQRPTLDKPSRVLYGPARQPLDVLGQFRGNMTQGPSQHLENIYVV